MDLELRGKVALVTGGSRGIGKAVAQVLATEGADVALVARSQEALDETAREIAGATGARVQGFTANTRDDASVQQMVQGVVEAFGHVDILVNCAAKAAGDGPPAKLGDVTTELFWDDVDTKVMGYLRCAQAVAPYMVRQGWGRIVNISGLAARSSGSILTGIRNVGVVAMTKNLADELGPHGVNVTVVHPGFTRTERTAGLIERQAEQTGKTPDEVEREMGQANSVRRIIDAQEVAWVVAFLASPKSIAINGDVVAAGGGSGKAIYY